MLTRTIVVCLLVCLCLAQPLVLAAQQPAPATLVVPAGTTVPLTLVNPIKSKSTKPGDAVRAVVAFPIIVDGQVAIPAGTYVNGILGATLPKVKHQPAPDVQLHLTRLVFANGYTATINAMLAQAAAGPPQAESEDAANYSDKPVGAGMGIGNSFASGSGQTTAPTPPALPPLPSVGPSPGVIVGASLGGAAAVTALAILLTRHRGGSSDYIVHDAGWQFQMKLESPLLLDASQVAIAAGGPTSPSIVAPAH